MFQNDAGSVLRSLTFRLSCGRVLRIYDCCVTVDITGWSDGCSVCFQALTTTSDVTFERRRRGQSVSALHLNPSHGLWVVSLPPSHVITPVLEKAKAPQKTSVVDVVKWIANYHPDSITLRKLSKQKQLFRWLFWRLCNKIYCFWTQTF